MTITAKNHAEAWRFLALLTRTDWVRDAGASERAGYPVYRSADPAITAWVSDLTARLEFNAGGRSLNIWCE